MLITSERKFGSETGLAHDVIDDHTPLQTGVEHVLLEPFASIE